MAEAAKVIPMKPPALHMGRLQEIGHARRELSALIPAGTKIDTILDPTYWKHYVRDIRPMDVIEAFCEDGSWEVSLRVMFVSTAEVQLKVRWHQEYDVSQEEEIESDILAVKWKGPAMKFAVIRKDTKEIIQSGFYPKGEAFKHLAKHLVQLKS